MDLYVAISEKFSSPVFTLSDFFSYLIGDDDVSFVACPAPGESIVRVYILNLWYLCLVYVGFFFYECCTSYGRMLAVEYQ